VMISCQGFKQRAAAGMMMVSGFALLIAMGHFYVALFVTLLTVLMFREIIGLKRNKEKDNRVQSLSRFVEKIYVSHHTRGLDFPLVGVT